ncbi:hypothetical protein Ancab_025672 [Ancistrocladus abbreviatus]
MSYDEVEIEDMEWNEELQAYTYPCPCGDLFQITKDDLRLGEEIARCPSCSLYITVIFNIEDFTGLCVDWYKNVSKRMTDTTSHFIALSNLEVLGGSGAPKGNKDGRGKKIERPRDNELGVQVVDILSVKVYFYQSNNKIFGASAREVALEVLRRL